MDTYVGDVGEVDHESEVLKGALVFRTHFIETTVVVANRGFALEEIEWNLFSPSEGPQAGNFLPLAL